MPGLAAGRDIPAPEGASCHTDDLRCNAERGGGGSIDTANINQPVVGFIFSNKGLMYNLTMEGTKITRIAR